ncbi:RNA-binding motif protein, X-linked 2 isoform X2 [Misgurnus anguillicaudatus]|uniref:RNA-binding motif protein, X-linked 2 isoform X2 n=1 Tax=Misgurnus anguillicaudatus TaxID=75329 RepID=UPI002435CAA7|nr:RNA-binding motif protein, X-linked 2 isoform X2 [Misgurnus anguillicaudatus]
MNPLTKVKLINELNEREADLGVKDTVSWHSVYKDSAWIFIGGLPYELTEGDTICVFSQYGEIANINLVRDKKTGKSKGFCFLCYEDQRSTVLAVDNFNGIKIKGRTIRVDHVANYRPPKDTDDIDTITKRLREEGCAPKVPHPSSSDSESEEEHAVPVKKPKKDKKEKKKKKKEKKEKKKALKEERREARMETSASSPLRVKKEKEDTAYEKYVVKGPNENRRDRPGQDRAPDVDRFRHGDERRSERDRERQTDRSREEKRHEDTRQRDNRDQGRGSDRERERDRDGVSFKSFQDTGGLLPEFVTWSPGRRRTLKD